MAQVRVTRWLAVCAAFAVWAAVPASAQQPQGMRIVPLPRGDQVLVSVHLTDGFTDEVRDAIRSGLRTTITYIVDLRVSAGFWFDRTIATSTVQSSVVFDNLERRYTVVRSVDGRDKDTLQTEDESAVRQFMTEMVRLPLFRTAVLQPNRDYYVNVSATARPGNNSLLWPFSSGTSGRAKFTFIR